MLVGWLPLDQQGPIVQPEAGGLLGHVDVKGCPRENGRDKERKLTSEHGIHLPFSPTIMPLVGPRIWPIKARLEVGEHL
jgi:hypothetical protein